MPYYMELYSNQSLIALCGFPLCLMLPSIISDYLKLGKSSSRQSVINTVSCGLNIQLVVCILFSGFSVANFFIWNFEFTHRLEAYADKLWIGSLFLLLILGFCQAQINTSVLSLSAVFPTQYGQAVQLGQSFSMVLAASANFLIVYFLFAFKVPLDKIENVEGVF
jgi:hypothetical protein